MPSSAASSEPSTSASWRPRPPVTRSNAAVFIAGVRTAFHEDFGADVAPEVVSGDEEASLSFAGATGGLAARGVSGPYLVVDLGGGSTEFVRGTDHVEAARSVDIGCVRLTERHLAGDPPTAAQIEAATVDVDAALDEPAVRALRGCRNPRRPGRQRHDDHRPRCACRPTRPSGSTSRGPARPT